MYILSRILVNYRRVLDRRSDLLDSLIESVTTFYTSLLHTYTHIYTHSSIHSHVFTSSCSVAASNGGRSPFSGFPNSPRPKLPASNSNSTQRLNRSSSLTHWLTQSLTSKFNSYWLTPPANLLLTNWHGPRRKYRSSFSVQLLLSGDDVLRCCLQNNRHGMRRKHHSSVAVYRPLLAAVVVSLLIS
jgi:hypothetical protein